MRIFDLSLTPKGTKSKIMNIQNDTAVNAGIDEVIAKHFFDFYDVDENYQFSIDTDGDVIFDKRY